MFAAIKQGVTVLGTTTSSCCITTSRVLRKLPTTTTPAPAPAPAAAITTTAVETTSPTTPTTAATTTRTLRKNCIHLGSNLWYQPHHHQHQQQQHQHLKQRPRQPIQQHQHIHHHQHQHQHQYQQRQYSSILHHTTNRNRNTMQTRRGMMMMMARSSLDPSHNPSTQSESKAMTFLRATLGYEEKIAQGVISALKQSGVSTDAALLSMVRTLAGRWEVDEDAGLEALVESVTLELARSDNKQVIQFWIVPSNGWSSQADGEGEEEEEGGTTDLSRAVRVEGYEDLSLTDVAKFGDSDGAQVLGEMIECACSGIMACSTCHIVVANEWFEKVGAPSEAELDMIDLAYNPTATSRLGCQVILTPKLNNAIFKLPRGANNMMDFIPFEDV